MLICQKDKFEFEEGITYLNGAYMSPLLKSVAEIGCDHLKKKMQPWRIAPAAFFDQVDRLKSLVSRMLNIDTPDRIAIIPSASYGVANAAKNIDFKKGDRIVLLDRQFPSNYYIWKKIANQKELHIDIVSPPAQNQDRGKKWNANLLDAINERTKVVSMEHVHWTDGTLFDLEAVRKKTRQVGALLIVDATQSMGAYPFDQQIFQVDALIAAAYKFMMGPYAMGLAYYGPAFDQGQPIEENWINKEGSEVFEKLLDYTDEYKPGASRYSMGEQSQFIHVPMQIAATEQLLSWGVDQIQSYCASLVDPLLPVLEQQGIWIEDQPYRANHLFGLKPSQNITPKLKQNLMEHKVYVSYRGDTIRVSPNVYNTLEDLQKLINLLSP
ncbi:MAG: aminotransferase class V-fold PLP-dependent enzyme [Saprospiraceae bacterium]|jgi:selenocysteine lyase/cysteine desulfurase|nr:aminotransferase class V-fold PLP-dependent enzyme [Saprospiraceae bacterium]MBP7802680.1 aminotransferase class V-fold PLP-dependent enzyme [Saprospiraceae bacterium]MBP8097440.1 aminotransferase class V-fold PLP-dependent enzyme [Saprospiraceae bacterium]